MEHQLLKAGQTFANRYRIEKFLAEGGMGAVFVGEHTATEQRVAVKVLWPHVLGSKDAVEKFQLEAKVAGRVSSDHIVRVIDAGYDDETRMPFLVMELLKGKTLEALVCDDGPVPPGVLLSLMRQVASGLDKAHGYVDKDGVAKPIVHRDLKPENLFLARRDTGEPLVKILDFGIAKVVSEGTHVSQEIKGTPLFMAFEQAGGGRITPKTDIWALGLIIFYLLTGKNYWRSAQPDSDAGITQLFGEVISLPIEPPSMRIREFGGAAPWLPAFDDWFSHCVNRDLNQRFATAGDAINALAQVLPVDAAALSTYAYSFLENPTTANPPVQARTAIGPAQPGPGQSQPQWQQSPSQSQPQWQNQASQGLSQSTGSAPAPSSSKTILVVIAAVAGVLVMGGIATLLALQSKPSTPVADDSAPRPTASATAAQDAPPATTTSIVSPVSPVSPVTPVASASVAGTPPTPPPATPPHPGVPGKPPTAPPDPNAGKTKPPPTPPATPPPTPGKPTADPYGDR